MDNLDHSAPESQNHALIVVFDVFALLGFLLFLFTLLPAALSKAVQRSVVWYSLIMAWLVYTTTLIYAVPALASTATLCYYIEFFLVFYCFRSGRPRQLSSTGVVWLVITPWVAFLAIIVEVLLFTFLGDHLSQVERTTIGFYCHLTNRTPSLVSASVVVADMVVLLSLEGYTGYLMIVNWDVFKRLNKNDRQIFITVYLRLILCTIAAILAFVFSTWALTPESSGDLSSFIYPALPIIIAFAFGTQKDLLRTWLFWRSPKPYGTLIFNNGTRNDSLLASTLVVYTSDGDIITALDNGSSGISEQNRDEEC